LRVRLRVCEFAGAWHAFRVMSAAQWAPWVAVFLGGCLSGAALLSLTSERAADAQQVVTVSPPPSTPSEPADSDEAIELGDEEAAESDTTASHSSTGQSGDADPTELAESEHGPSAADILAEREREYPGQVAAAEAPPEPAESAVAEADSTDVEAESVPPPAAPPAALAAASDERLAEIETERERADARADVEPVYVATEARAEQAPVQQIAVVYQPVYVLPPAADPTGQARTSSSRRSAASPCMRRGCDCCCCCCSEPRRSV